MRKTVRDALNPAEAAAVGEAHLAVGQNQWYHFGVGTTHFRTYFSGDWDVHWGTGF